MPVVLKTAERKKSTFASKDFDFGATISPIPSLAFALPPNAMDFRLVEVEDSLDFFDVIECQWQSYENPLQNFFRMFCPVRGEGDAARVASLRESASRQWEWHTSDPASHWFKVVDPLGKIAGACLWKIYTSNPFGKAGDHSEAYWYPEGEAREYVTKSLEQFDAPRRRLATRPQVCK